MSRSAVIIPLFSALLVGSLLGAASSPARAELSAAGLAKPVKQAPPPPHDPTKKNPGDACKSSDECQTHHTCAKVGDKNVCQAPPRRELPPGAVT